MSTVVAMAFLGRVAVLNALVLTRVVAPAPAARPAGRSTRPKRWGYLRGMPKVSVYLPDDLYRAAQDQGLPVSSLAQEAIARELRRRRNEEWIAAVRRRAPRCREAVDTPDLMDQVRAEFGA